MQLLTYLMYLPLFKMFWKTSSGVSSLKGGTPVKNSNRHTPSAHQSTGIPINQTKMSYIRWKSLKGGGIPVKTSNRHTPSAHQSTGIPIN